MSPTKQEYEQQSEKEKSLNVEALGTVIIAL